MNSMANTNESTAAILDSARLIDELWEAAVQTASPGTFGPRCERLLRAWNCLAVERMEEEGRLTPEDLATAKTNLRRFIDLVKTEAVFLGHANHLNRDCFNAAHRRLERHSMLAQFTLWPFWPNTVAVNDRRRR